MTSDSGDSELVSCVKPRWKDDFARCTVCREFHIGVENIIVESMAESDQP